MRINHQGWESGGNAPVRVDEACPIIVACAVSEASHDTQPAAPLATVATLAEARIAWPTEEAGATKAMPAPLAHGDEREGAVPALETSGGDPAMSTGRQPPQASEVGVSAPPATAKERMAATGRTPEGRAWSARRTVIVEPVCGQSKEARGCRRFLHRGLTKRRGAWGLVCLTPHGRTLWRYGCAPSTVSHEERAPS